MTLWPRRLPTSAAPGDSAWVFAAVGVIVVARSAILVFWEQSHIDSNQAVIGLMAKHLTELRAFPVFMYGQNYLLAVEAWLAAPVFLIAGVSVTALKLPLLAINLAVAFLLLRTLIRETRLPPALAGLAALFFVLPGPGTAAQLLEASGGNIEPFLYVLLLWLTRNRPGWCGLVLGIGFLNREFTIYGFVALMILSAAHHSLQTRVGARRILTMLGVVTAAWVVVQFANQYASAVGPGTSLADLRDRPNSSIEILNRFCFDWRALPGGLWDIATVHWPQLFATKVQPLYHFGIESLMNQGMPGLGVILGGAMLLASVRIVTYLARDKRWHKDYDFCAYLVLVGALSVAGYVGARCGMVDPNRLRYDLLSILGAVGIAGWYLRIERVKAIRIAWTLLVLCWAAAAVVAHSRLWSEYLGHPPIGGKHLIIRHLDARGIRYAKADYWNAYSVTFLTNERIIVASTNRFRIRLYEREAHAHRDEAVSIERRPCADGERVLASIYFCPP